MPDEEKTLKDILWENPRLQFPVWGSNSYDLCEPKQIMMCLIYHCHFNTKTNEWIDPKNDHPSSDLDAILPAKHPLNCQYNYVEDEIDEEEHEWNTWGGW